MANWSVVVGASAGGVEALTRLASLLPDNFAAPLFVVLHLPEHARSHLPEILGRQTKLTVAPAKEGEPFFPGGIFVAPPGNHLLVDKTVTRVTKGPSENGHRPAVNKLFCTALFGEGGESKGAILLVESAETASSGEPAPAAADGRSAVNGRTT